jgi:UDPglucose 6-dehydrogenase
VGLVTGALARAIDTLGARVVGYDSVAGKKVAGLSPGIKVVFDPYEALSGTHGAVVVTEWEEVRALDLGWAAALMEPPKLLVDGRNTYDPIGPPPRASSTGASDGAKG